MTTNKLKALAVAASATVQRYTPATIGKITREDMAVCKAYQVAAVPGDIVVLIENLERLTAVEESVIAMARMLNNREWAEHVGKGAASDLESAITNLHNELVQARAVADEMAGGLLAKAQIELNAYQIRALLEMVDASGDPEMDDPIILAMGGEQCHSGPGLYAHYRECPEEGSSFIGENEEDQQRANKLSDAFEAKSEVQP